jgi:hypothetical protein
VSACLATIGWRFLTFAGFSNDDYVHLAGAQQILLGEWPVRDFVDAGTPLMYVVHAGTRAAFGPALGVEWAVMALGFGLGAACTLGAAYRLSSSLSIALLVTALEAAMYPRGYGSPKLLLYSAAALVIVWSARRSGLRAVLATATITSVSFLYRHDHGVFIGAGALTAIIAGGRYDGWRVAIRRSAMYVAIVTLQLLPWLVFVHVHQGITDYVASGIAASRAEAVGDALRELPRLGLGDFASTRNALAWLFYAFHALPVACLALLVYRRAEDETWRGETAAVAGLSVIAVAVNVSFLRGNLEARVPDAVVPAALLGSWLLGTALRRSSPRVGATVVAGALLAITIWASGRVGEFSKHLEKSELLRGPSAVWGRAFDLWDRFHRRVPERDHIPSRYALALMPFMAYVDRCTAPQDRLLVTGFDPEINVIANRGFAGGHSSFRPHFYTSDADQARSVDTLRRQSVPFVVSISQVYPELKAQMPAVIEYIERHFALLAHVDVSETQGVDLLIDRSRHTVETDVITGWPCLRVQPREANSRANSGIE